MEKAFDVADLKAKIFARAKENGLTLAEESIEDLIDAVFVGAEEWLEESVDLTPTPVDNLLLSAFSFFKERIQEQVKKAIDLDDDGD